MKTKTSEPFARMLAVAMITSTAFSFATPELAPGTAGEISEFIAMDISTDSHMQDAKVNVRIKDGIAILTGRATTLDQAERAAERAMAAVKVRAVVNQIEVRPATAATSTLLENVRKALDENPALDAKRITLHGSGGKLVLNGEVGTWDEQEIARETASRVPGVTAIENRTEVVFDSVRTDAQITEQLRQLIANDPLYDGLALSASVKEGIVRLKGELGSRGEYDRLVRRASVTGVFEVNADRLTINSDLKMEAVEDKHFPPEEMMAALRDAMKTDSRLAGAEISSQLAEGVVTLSGQVPEEGMRTAAESTARGVPGVLAVDNRIHVGEASPRPLVSASAPLVKP